VADICLKVMTSEFLKEVGWLLLNASTCEICSHICWSFTSNI